MNVNKSESNTFRHISVSVHARSRTPALTYFGLSLAGLMFASLSINCFPGGIVSRGGDRDNAGFVAEATLTHGAPYKIVCYDSTEAARREIEKEKEKEKPDYKPSDTAQAPPVRFEDSSTYRGGCEEEGESSVFFLFNIIPVTPPLSPEYAIGVPVQKLEGDTMIHIRYWHETHYYSILGRVSVLRVRGDIIKFLTEEERLAQEEERKKREKQRALDKAREKTQPAQNPLPGRTR